MPETPTPHELERRLDRDLAGLQRRMDEGFGRVERAIEQLRFVHPDVFVADQQRQDDAIAAVRGEMREAREHADTAKDAAETAEAETLAAMAELRKQFIAGLVAVIMILAGVALATS